MNGKLLHYNERKRYYKIKINYEPEEYIQKEFELKYDDMNKKIKDSIIPMLLSHINRVKKRNELRPEIKRIAASDRPEEEDEEKEEKDEVE